MHLTQMKQGNKMVSVSQLVKRNQRVFVKVVSVLGERLPGAAPSGIRPFTSRSVLMTVMSKEKRANDLRKNEKAQISKVAGLSRDTLVTADNFTASCLG